MSSLEEAIRIHAAAIEKLAVALSREAPAIVAAADNKPAKPPKKDPAPAATPAVATPAATPPPAATASTAAAATPSTADLVTEGKALILKVIAKKGRPEGVKLLNGSAKVSELDPAKLPAFIEACKQALA